MVFNAVVDDENNFKGFVSGENIEQCELKAKHFGFKIYGEEIRG